MSYIERALERLNKLIEKSAEDSDEQIDFIVMKQACEKQVVRKVVNKCSTFTMAECPHCNGTVNFHKKHCGWCGQKLDWEVENE